MSFKIHPRAEVQTEQIGEGTIVWQNCVILKGAKIGSNCNINLNVFIENDVEIGNNVTIKPCVQIWDGLRIEDDVFVGPNVTFTNDKYPRSKQYPEQFIQTVIKKGASIGAASVILCGLTIGKNSMVGAGSVLTKSIPDNELWFGNPAKHRGYISSDNQLLSINLTDKNGVKYCKNNSEIIPAL